jgi:choline kinase
MPKTDVVILAAGIGSRLAPVTDTQPKCLTDLNGKSLINRVVEQFLAHDDVQKVHVVIGYLGDQIVEALSKYGDRVSTVMNETFRTTNNLFSFTLSQPSLVPDSQLILLNGDCAYEDEIIDAVVKSSDARSQVVVDSSIYMDESMKVSIDDTGVISHIAKTITQEDAFATSIDLYRLVAMDKATLLAKADSIFATSGLNTWTEVALAECFADGSIEATPLDIAGARWYEIDNHEDLAAAQALFTGL